MSSEASPRGAAAARRTLDELAALAGESVLNIGVNVGYLLDDFWADDNNNEIPMTEITRALMIPSELHDLSLGICAPAFDHICDCLRELEGADITFQTPGIVARGHHSFLDSVSGMTRRREAAAERNS